MRSPCRILAQRVGVRERGRVRSGSPLPGGSSWRCATAVILFDPETGARETVCSIEADVPDTRLNDGKVGPDGAFWVGSMDDRPQKEPIGALYRVDPSGEVLRKVEGMFVSNGLAWTADGEVMFFADLRGPWIDRWRFDRWSGDDVGADALRRHSTRRPAGRTAAAATPRVFTGAPASPPGVSTASRRTARSPRPMTCRCRRRPCRASAGPDSHAFLTSLREGPSAEVLGTRAARRRRCSRRRRRWPASPPGGSWTSEDGRTPHSSPAASPPGPGASRPTSSSATSSCST